jgi:choline dehydrogenase-like flavoprotein
VVDARLVIAGDASVMPTITSGNTNAPAMRVAGKALR